MKPASTFTGLLFLALCLPPICQAGEPYEAITDKEINEITYEDCEIDNGFEIPFAANLENVTGDQKERLDEWKKKFEDWKPAKEEKIGQKVRNIIALLSIVDAGHGEFEAEAPYVAYEWLKSEVPKAQLIKATAWVALKMKEGDCIKTAPDMGMEVEIDEEEVRGRSSVYAKKMLGRLLGKLPKEP
ncbi:MAG TPA: hypothetical protein VEK08_23130 [Planctomycetota bacterium]|nr:hypothetical protein [Planctomycetota bacterium]